MEEFAPGQKRGTCCTKHRRFTWDLRRSCPPRLDGSMELFSPIKKNATTPGGGAVQLDVLFFSFFVDGRDGTCGVWRRPGEQEFLPIELLCRRRRRRRFLHLQPGGMDPTVHKKPSSAASRVLRPLLLWVKGTPDCFLSDRSGRAGSPDAPPLGCKNLSPPLKPKIRDLQKKWARKGGNWNFLRIFSLIFVDF